MLPNDFSLLLGHFSLLLGHFSMLLNHFFPLPGCFYDPLNNFHWFFDRFLHFYNPRRLKPRRVGIKVSFSRSFKISSPKINHSCLPTRQAFFFRRIRPACLFVGQAAAGVDEIECILKSAYLTQ